MPQPPAPLSAGGPWWGTRRLCLQSLGAWLLLPSAGAAHGLAPSGTLDYEVQGQARGIGYRATSRLRWQRQGLRYEAEWEVRARWVGSRTQQSHGEWGAQIQPTQFTDRSRRERRYELDPPQQRYRFFQDGELAQQGPLPPGTQDRLSVWLALALWAQRHSGQRPPAPWVVPVIQPDGAQPWTWLWRGPDAIDTPAGRLQALRIDRQEDPDATQHTRVWLHEAVGWLPVRLRVQDAQGDWVEQTLRQLPRS
jgi:hypothetical protein